MHMGKLRRPQVYQHSEKYVIFIALVYVIGLTHCTTTMSTESLEDLSESPILQCNFTSNFILDCSKLKLSAIPKNIPNTTVHLNLSHNSLQQIDDDAFDECCENVKVLNLSHNEISTLNRRHFENMKNLEVIFLDSNRFTEFDADTFQSLKNLKQLNLNRNSIELKGSSTRGFLIQSSLEELNLENCKIDEIPDSAFVNMTQLERLSLAGNPLDESLDTDAFVPLTNLIKLRIPNLTQSTIYQICDKLTAIDIISFDEFNVSCTVLSDNQAFDEAIILNDPVELPKVQSLSPPITRKPTTTEAATSSATAMTLPAANETSTDALKPQIETSDGDATNKTKIDMGTAAIDIDNSTIKFILVGIFGVTVVGILIGLICRADVCGVKTKMCRSKKNNRRAPTATDTVSPFEEIPLNSVNGKATEG